MILIVNNYIIIWGIYIKNLGSRERFIVRKLL